MKKGLFERFIMSKKFLAAFSVGAGAIMGGLLAGIGLNTGEYHGIVETNQNWRDAIEEAKKDLEEKKTETETE